MNENIAATKTKTTKPLPDYGMPKFDIPNMEMPEVFREMTEKGVAHAKDTYAKAKVASEEAAGLFESTFACAAKGLTGYNLKLIEITRANTRAAFDYAHELMSVKSPAEFIELSTAQMRKQFESASAQNKELCALVQQVAGETAEPIKIGVSKAFNKAA